MLDISHDVERINQIINDPDVRPFVGGVELGDIDIAPAVERSENWFLMGEHGGFGLIWTAQMSTKSIHLCYRLSGKRATQAAKAMIDFARK
jgi:hypothetical protein